MPILTIVLAKKFQQTIALGNTLLAVPFCVVHSIFQVRGDDMFAEVGVLRQGRGRGSRMEGCK